MNAATAVPSDVTLDRPATSAAAGALWRPHRDEPLFGPELLADVAAIPHDLRDRIVGYLTAVARYRQAPLHTCTAFNALHFGFDLDTGGYRAEVLDPDLFVPVVAGTEPRTALPVGTFIRLDRGQRSLWAEVVARFGADPAVEGDGWVPPGLSGRPQPDSDGVAHERVILDATAFGASLSAAEQAALRRLRSRGDLLDARGHLTGPVRYPPDIPDVRDDVGLYAAHLLTTSKPLLTGGPLGGLLTAPDDDAVLAAALRQALNTVDALLTAADSLRRWASYAIPRERPTRRRGARAAPGLGDRDLEEVLHMVRRAGPKPRYTAVWPLLALRTELGDPTGDPLDLTQAAETVVRTNVAIADAVASAAGTPPYAGLHLRVDDVWQAGAVWRAERLPVDVNVLGTDPCRPLGLGFRGVVGTGTESGTVEAGVVDDVDDAVPAPAVVAGPNSTDEEARDDAAAAWTVEVETIDNSLVVYTTALSESQLGTDILPLPAVAAAVIDASATLVVELHHDGAVLDESELVHQVTNDHAVLRGVAWPLSFYPGIKITVAVARGARRLSAMTTLLDDPLPFGAAYRWAADMAILAAALGVAAPADLPDPTHDADASTTDDGKPPASSPNRGIDQLRNMIIAVLRRHGAPGAFGARRMTGPQLLAGLFGDDLVNPPLMWQAIYTCERLVEAGRLTCEPNPAKPGQPNTGGPDVFAWWPDQAARLRAHQHATAQQPSLAEFVRGRWVPPFCRLLPEGYHPSDQARTAYAAWVRKVYGPRTDPVLPVGYTFVRGHPRGHVEDDSWIQEAIRKNG